MINKTKILLNLLVIFISFPALLCLFSLVPPLGQTVLIKITAVTTILILLIALVMNGFILLQMSTSLVGFWEKVAYISGFSIFSMLVMYVLYQFGFETIKEHVSQFGFDITTGALVIVNILQSFALFAKNKELKANGTPTTPPTN
jgi:hypothetical protein